MNWQDWQDIELGHVLIFLQNGKICSMLCSFLPWTGTGNMIPGSDEIPGSRDTAASAMCALCSVLVNLHKVHPVELWRGWRL